VANNFCFLKAVELEIKFVKNTQGKVTGLVSRERDPYILHQATGSRAPGASSRRSRPTHWLGYTGETHGGGLKTFDFLLVHGGGLRLYSRDF
jgi:hypothetical protein